MNRNNPLIASLVRSINDAICEARADEPEANAHLVKLTQGTHLIEVYVSPNMCEVTITDNAHPCKEFIRVPELIERNLITWNEAAPSPYNIWDDHGFSDESDYNRWRYGA